jgi:hypothetical protein
MAFLARRNQHPNRMKFIACIYQIETLVTDRGTVKMRAVQYVAPDLRVALLAQMLVGASHLTPKQCGLDRNAVNLLSITYRIRAIIGQEHYHERFVHPFTTETFWDNMTISRLDTKPLFVTEDLGFLLRAPALKGRKGLQWTN